VKIYNTIAKNLSDWNKNIATGNSDSIYIKYYPSQYYELDNRNVITINVPFNGKTIGTYKYSPNTTLPPEISFIHLNYLASPVILMDMATVTQVVKRDVWGEMLSNNYDTNNVLPTSVGFAGQKQDYDSDLTYAHARYLSVTNKTWLSRDSFGIENFNNDVWLLDPQTQNSYSYSKNDPVNKLDPDGKLTIIVPGTWYANSTWSSINNPLYQSAVNSWNDPNTYIFNDRSRWSGGNNDYDRQTAANNLADFINNYEFADGEQLNLVMHSHGGNVGKITLRMLNDGIKVDNFVTLGTPVIDRYKTDLSRVKNMLEVYSDYDWTQVNGGDSMKIGGLVGWAANRGRTEFKGTVFGYFETGMAARFESTNSAIDVTSQTPKSYTSISQTHGELYSVMSIWTNYVDEKLIKPKK
jgi:RHS repeat-associated protein